MSYPFDTAPFLFAFYFRNIAFMVIHKTFADFVLFLYVHMAYADGHYHPLEHAVIIEKAHKLFPSATDAADLVVKAEEAYRSVDQSKVQSIIRDTFLQFNTVKFSQKYKIYTDM